MWPRVGLIVLTAVSKEETAGDIPKVLYSGVLGCWAHSAGNYPKDSALAFLIAPVGPD